ncbi:hypothetical protein GCM10008908_22210 [Clostridium subterminale]|uniref:Uncharacterized protein n=1 Tax=Clostridium subterminale TaxID=1550 RepID=A0ABP3W457_CLOSU
MSIVLTVLNILLIVVSVIYMLKNILINYKLSNSGLKNACVAILLCVMVWFAGNGAFLGVKLIESEDTLEYMRTSEKEEYEGLDIVAIEKTISSEKEYIGRYTAVSGISFIAFVLLIKNVSKEIKERPTTSKWDLSKFK